MEIQHIQNQKMTERKTHSPCFLTSGRVTSLSQGLVKSIPFEPKLSCIERGNPESQDTFCPELLRVEFCSVWERLEVEEVLSLVAVV